MVRASVVKQLAELGEICTLWLNSRKPNVKESTYTRYVRTVNKYILPYFEQNGLIKICNSTVNAVFDKLKAELSIKTISDIRCVFKSIWNYGRENGYPCCEVKFPNVVKAFIPFHADLPIERVPANNSNTFINT